MKTIEELQTQINELQKELESLKNPPNYKRWRAETNTDYYYICEIMEIERHKEVNDEIDIFLYQLGNYYKTKEEAEKVRDKQLAIMRVNDRIDELNKGWKHNNKLERFSIFYFKEYKVDYLFNDNYVRDNIIKCCKTLKIAQQIIDEMKDDLDLIFNLK